MAVLAKLLEEARAVRCCEGGKSARARWRVCAREEEGRKRTPCHCSQRCLRKSGLYVVMSGGAGSRKRRRD